MDPDGRLEECHMKTKITTPKRSWLLCKYLFSISKWYWCNLSM